ncbi:MAG: DUF4157 domain-containing protein [Desulfobacteraceae bacterium]|nr:DUF4157 domain-containing protein [Desulfobacteraceae bacterium]
MEHELTKSKTSRAAGKQGAVAQNRQQLPSHYIHHLQRTIGNRAVQRLIQAKLDVSQPGDAYEQEADQFARRIVTMPTPQAQPANQPQAMPRQEDKKPVQMKSPTESVAQREAKSGEAGEVGDDIEQQLNQSIGNGSALPDHTRSFMEPRFGTDFSDVRIHTGHKARQMNKALSAQAFTVGSDIYYGPGKSPSDLELTAHELTHVVQQRGAGAQSKHTESGDAVKGLANPSHGHVLDMAPPGSALTSPGQGLSRRMIQRRGVPIPSGAVPVPAPNNTVDGSRVVSKLNQMGSGMRRGFEGFNGTPVERTIVNAFETANLQPRSIAINWVDERGINMIWTGTVNIRMENSAPVQGSGGSGTGSVTGAGGGSGTSGTSTSSSSTAGGSAEVSAGGHEGAAGGKLGGSASTTTGQSETQGATGSATTGATAANQLNRYECSIIADIHLNVEMDFSGSDYFNPFKWGGAISSSLIDSNRRDSVGCGRWTYIVSTGFAPPPPAP